MDYRGRFAPSPTGHLHFGSLVAAVGSWLCARHAGGQWLLRVEDIDPPREMPGSAESILAALPAFGLVAGEDGTANPVFDENDVVSALKEASARGVKLQNIRSVAGFERRLNDITCAGCHQTRGIGGFHFPGVDWLAAKPSNTIVVPASPHFFGDQVRRRDILAAFRDGREVDLSRGFSSRPQLRGSTELAGTEYEDGWGAHCYVQHAGEAENDVSFRSWTCAEGLACQTMNPASRMGMCFVKNR